MTKAAVMVSLTIQLPMPPQCLLPNRTKFGRGARFQVTAAKRAQRESAKYLAVVAIGRALPPRWKSATIHATFWPSHHAGLGADPMNRIHSLKAAVDGLEDAGVFENDRGVQWGPVKHGGIDEVNPHVDLLIVPSGMDDGAASKGEA